MNRAQLSNKVFGCLGGYILGDAMGMPVEFLTPREIKKKVGYLDQLINPVNHYSSSELPAGKVTDDTKQTLYLLETFLGKGEISPRTTADALLRWVKEDNAFEKSYTGPSTTKALKKIQKGEDPRETGKRGTTVGGAMRIPSVALMSLYGEGLVEKVACSCLPTHGTSVAISAASAIAGGIVSSFRDKMEMNDIISNIINEAKKGVNFGVSYPAASVSKRIEWACSNIQKSNSENEAARKLYDYIGCGMAANEAVPTAVGIFYFTNADPMDSITMAVNMGGDTDTIAALAGALAGSKEGKGALNLKMLNKILQINEIPLDSIVTSVVNYLQKNPKDNIKLLNP